MTVVPKTVTHKPPGTSRPVAFDQAAPMTIDAFRKALHDRPLSQQERASLTPHELFVLVLASRLDRLTEEEQQRLEPGDWQYLAWAGLVSGGPGPVELKSTRIAGEPAVDSIREACS